MGRPDPLGLVRTFVVLNITERRGRRRLLVCERRALFSNNG